MKKKIQEEALLLRLEASGDETRKEARNI